MRTKNLIWSSLAIMMVATMNVGVMSCSDDDDDSASDSMGVLDKESGLRLASVGDSKYYYDTKGRIAGIKGDNSYFEFTYNPNKIICSYYYGEDEDDDEDVFTVSYNGSGYLSEIINSYSDEYEDDSWSGKIQCTLSYDGDGHLTKISGLVTKSGIEDGEHYNDKWTFAYTLGWRNNQLLSVVYNDYNYGDGDYTDTWTFSYDDDTYENVYRQWTPSLAFSYGEDDPFTHCLYLGLTGVGPTMLPSAAKETVEDYDGETYNYSYTFSYGFNNDGSVSYSAVNGRWYDFTYDGTDAYAGIRPKVSQLPVSKKKKPAHKFCRMFKRSFAH